MSVADAKHSNTSKTWSVFVLLLIEHDKVAQVTAMQNCNKCELLCQLSEKCFIFCIVGDNNSSFFICYFESIWTHANNLCQTFFSSKYMHLSEHDPRKNTREIHWTFKLIFLATYGFFYFFFYLLCSIFFFHIPLYLACDNR